MPLLGYREYLLISEGDESIFYSLKIPEFFRLAQGTGTIFEGLQALICDFFKFFFDSIGYQDCFDFIKISGAFTTLLRYQEYI